MTEVKRLEIVVDAPHGPRIIELLVRHGIKGWTVIPNVTGSGDRGLQFGDELTGVSSNQLIVTTCPPDALETLLPDLRRLLMRSGGTCLVSDAVWLRH